MANTANRSEIAVSTSALERASREISSPKIAATSPMHTRDTNRANLARSYLDTRHKIGHVTLRQTARPAARNIDVVPQSVPENRVVSFPAAGAMAGEDESQSVRQGSATCNQ